MFDSSLSHLQLDDFQCEPLLYYAPVQNPPLLIATPSCPFSLPLHIFLIVIWGVLGWRGRSQSAPPRCSCIPPSSIQMCASSIYLTLWWLGNLIVGCILGRETPVFVQLNIFCRFFSIKFAPPALQSSRKEDAMNVLPFAPLWWPLAVLHLKQYHDHNKINDVFKIHRAFGY